MTARTMSLTGGNALTRVTRNRLADGRELLFFDRDDPAPRTAADRRELPPPGGASELRWVLLQGEWEVIASHRQARTFRPAPGDCPLCPSPGATRTEIPEPGYEVVTFENRPAAFAPEHVVPRPGPRHAGPGLRLLRYPDRCGPGPATGAVRSWSSPTSMPPRPAGSESGAAVWISDIAPDAAAAALHADPS